MLNTSSRLSGVLAAKRRFPAGASARGRTCPDSNSVKDPVAVFRIEVPSETRTVVFSERQPRHAKSPAPNRNKREVAIVPLREERATLAERLCRRNHLRWV